MTALRKSDVNLTSRFVTLGIPDGFVSITDKETIGICTHYLDNAWEGKREFRALAKRIGVPTGAICALLNNTHRIKGKPYQFLHFMNDHNPLFNSVLMECGAIPDNLLKGWMIPCSEDCLSVIRTELCKFFKIVLCNEDKALGIYKNSAFREAPNAAPDLHNESVSISRHGIHNSIIDARPNEKIGPDSISVFDGVEFLTLNNEVRTRLHYFLIRYYSNDIKPRFALVNSLSWKVEIVTVGVSSAGTKALLDRFKLEIKAVSTDVDDVITVK